MWYRRIKRHRRRPRSQKATEHYLEHKETARQLVLARLSYFNQFYGFKIGRVAIRSQKSRWGSCSAKGNLNFNYRIIFLPPELQDYIIVHEICHLKELNHGAGFWSLVGEQLPDYLLLRRGLRYHETTPSQITLSSG